MASGKEDSADRAKRLRAQGDWSAFCQAKQEFIAQGMARKQADIAAAAKFPPKLVAADGQQNAVYTYDGKTAPIAADIDWARANIGTDRVPNDAPTAGAAWWYKFGTQNPDGFAAILAKMLPNRAQQESADKFTDDGRDQLTLIERVQRAGKSA